jgi:hypothetical protein
LPLASLLWQATLTKEANEITRRNNVVSQRAFMHPGIPNTGLATNSIDHTQLLTVEAPLINSGNTATKDLEFFIRCAPSTDALPDPWFLLYREKVESHRQFIAPHQTYTDALHLSIRTGSGS